MTITTTTSEPPGQHDLAGYRGRRSDCGGRCHRLGTSGASANSLVATFTTTDPDATVGDFMALVDWGDGTAPSVGTISVFGAVPNGVTFRIFGTHAYARPGVFPITTMIASIGGSAAVAHGTAVIAASAPSAPLSGQLQPASDTGISNSDGMTKDNTPTFIGTAQPGGGEGFLHQ